MRKLRKGDVVQVMSGQSKGKTGEILRVDTAKSKVVIKGVAIQKKCVKPTQDNQKGGIFDVERPIDWSTVMILDPKHKKPTRVRFELNSHGKKIRISVLSGEPIDN